MNRIVPLLVPALLVWGVACDTTAELKATGVQAEALEIPNSEILPNQDAASDEAAVPTKDGTRSADMTSAASPAEGMPKAIREAIDTAVANLPDGYKPRTRHLDPDGNATFSNRLILERSPYLRQHAHNPVHWFPWGDEAFSKAKREGKPVFMSIGYTTCHWCHVMEEESFEDLEIAAYMNEHFIAVKVDREERPDVDGIYMTAVNLLTGRGGWPMSVWMTSERKPFMAGTYFPPRDGVRGSRKGFLTLLKELKEEFASDPETVLSRATDLVRRVQASSRVVPSPGMPGEAALHKAANAYLRTYDKDYGGFGRGNKFPRSSNIDFLLRYVRRTGNEEVKRVVVHSLDAMAMGGLYDHVDDGFHRYTTERRFRIPHFEKMLYDNAQLVNTYLEASQYLKEPKYAEVARKTLDYLIRDMIGPEGGFYSATDADSEGEEGVFAVWSPATVLKAVGPELAPFIQAYYNITRRGNFEHGTTVLYTTGTPEEAAQRVGVGKAKAAKMLEEGRKLLYTARQAREQPILDDKVLTAWNGLAISAFARGALVLGEPRYEAVASRAAQFLKEKMWQNGKLARRYHSGEVRYDGVLDDYTYLIQGLLDLYQGTGREEWFRWARELQTTQDREFWSAGGGYFMTANSGEQLVSREMPDYDGARPSGNSVAAHNLLRFYGLTGDVAYKNRVESLFKALGRGLSRGTTGLPKLLSALDFYTDRSLQIVLAGNKAEIERVFLGDLRKRFVPNRVLAFAETGAVPSENGPAVLQGKGSVQGKPTAYVCEEGVCQRPVHSGKALLKQIRSLYSPLSVAGTLERKPTSR